MPRYFDTFRSHQPRFHKHTEVLLQNQSESDAGLLPLSESKGAAGQTVVRTASWVRTQQNFLHVGLVVFHRTEE